MAAKKKPSRGSKPVAAKSAGKAAAKAPDPVAASSARDLARLVGVTHTAVNAWLKRDEWPFGAGPWKASDVVRIQQWRETHLLDRPSTDVANPAAHADPAAVSPERGMEQLSISKKADVALKMKRREVLAFGLEVQQGKYHAVEQCQRDRLAAIHEVKQGLLDLADSFPGTADDKTILKGRIFELLRRFSGRMGVAATPDAIANH